MSRLRKNLEAGQLENGAITSQYHCAECRQKGVSHSHHNESMSVSRAAAKELLTGLVSGIISEI
jgi:hypothetical protein